MKTVYFARPEDDVILKPLSGSTLIDAARKAQGDEVEAEEEMTAKDWILRRALMRRKGGDFSKSGGTEEGAKA